MSATATIYSRWLGSVGRLGPSFWFGFSWAFILLDPFDVHKKKVNEEALFGWFAWAHFEGLLSLKRILFARMLNEPSYLSSNLHSLVKSLFKIGLLWLVTNYAYIYLCISLRFQIELKQATTRFIWLICIKKK